MCSNARREGIKKFVKDHPKMDVVYQGKQGTATLSGFSQLEKISYWRDRGDAVNVDILADSFEEQGVELKVPTGRIAALGLRREVKINGIVIGDAKSVRMLTREARTSFEKKLHQRFPVVYVGTDIYEFTEKDCLNQKQLKLDF